MSKTLGRSSAFYKSLRFQHLLPPRNGVSDRFAPVWMTIATNRSKNGQDIYTPIDDFLFLELLITTIVHKLI